MLGSVQRFAGEATRERDPLEPADSSDGKSFRTFEGPRLPWKSSTRAYARSCGESGLSASRGLEWSPTRKSSTPGQRRTQTCQSPSRSVLSATRQSKPGRRQRFLSHFAVKNLGHKVGEVRGGSLNLGRPNRRH